MPSIEQQFEESKAFFKTHKTKDLKFRKHQLKLLSKSIKNHENDLLDALKTDLGKSPVEAYATEIGITLKSIKTARKELKNWSKTKQVDTPLFMFPAKSYIKQEPYGTVLIIGPFNYPVQLLFEPLIGAIAAGNTAIIKPSELTPHVATVIRQIIEDVFTTDYIGVIEGGIEETQTLINLPFDYIFFTGSDKVGQIVYEAASKNLVPVTLELGGKSPVIVDDTANIKVASDRISFGKFTNAGQTCVAPDYILVNKKVKNELIEALKQSIQEFYGTNIEESPDFGRIVNDKHFNRLNELLNVHQNHVIFGGPILPIITYDDFNEAVDIIQSKAKPLSLYLFSEDENTTHRVLNELSFGGGAINDTLMHLANPNLPFGGVGMSGIGQYHGKYTFQTFSHSKSYIFRSTRLDSSVMYPPYKGKFKYIRTFFKNL